MDTASANNQPHTVERFNPSGPLGRDDQLACPNPACGDPENLILVEQAAVETTAAFFDVGVTYPEIDRAEDTERIATQIPQRQIIGWRCGTCRNSYIGDNALNRLARLT